MRRPERCPAEHRPPLVPGCRRLAGVPRHPRAAQPADLRPFSIGEVVGAWADDRVFRNGTGNSTPPQTTCAPCTTWRAGSSMPRASPSAV